MTQELVVWALVAGLIGLVWVLTCAILTQHGSPEEARCDGAESADADQTETPHRRVAA